MYSFIRSLFFLIVCLALTSAAPDLKPSWKSPGKLKRSLKTRDIPQFILFTHDDNTDSRSSYYVTDVTKDFKNPNGCQINAAFYTTKAYSDCQTVKKLYMQGHEIGGHTMTHRKTSSLSSKEKKQEIAGVRKWLIEECGIPAKDVRGQRNPYLLGDPEMRQYMVEAGYDYDTSLPEHYNSKSSPSAARRLWPYNMKYGIVQMDSCKYFGQKLNKCSTKEKPDLVQIPMWMYQKSPGRPSSRNLMDPPNAYKVLKAELRRNYKAHMTPVGIWTHSTSTRFLDQENNRREVKKFLQYAMKLDGVWVVTPSQLLDWMQNPVPKQNMAQFMSKYKCS